MKKRFLLGLICLFVTAFSFASLAADFNLAEGTGMEAFAEEVENGTRLFDEADVLSEAEESQVETELKKLEDSYDQTMAVILVKDRFKEDMDAYADYLYYEGGFGVGSDRDGVLLVLDFGTDRNALIYAQGGAMRYLTDSAIEQIFYEHNGGLFELASAGDYAGMLLRYTGSLEDLYKQGIQENQYNYDPETGEIDYYKEPHTVRWWHFLVALLIAGPAAVIPVVSVKQTYAMTSEKKKARFVNRAYRTTAAFAFANAADSLINRHTVHVPIIRESSRSSSSSSSSSFGGGASTMHTSSGGGHHTSGGMKF